MKKIKEMKKLQHTTTGSLSGKISHCGTYAGEFQAQAWELLEPLFDDEPSFINNQWCDIMYFAQTGEVVAVFAEDALTCFDAELVYVYLDRADCPMAFELMEEKELY